ncbi:hypothetical protein HanHA89_Chr01g0007761 [Helianthus annuus]|nr:hypothetical protein HanHA89_Chr01g0007761 [Helianthus annuus]
MYKTTKHFFFFSFHCFFSFFFSFFFFFFLFLSKANKHTIKHQTYLHHTTQTTTTSTKRPGQIWVNF